jgi:alkylation response protein AidB-like acyl-CoA dehydrogenase
MDADYPLESDHFRKRIRSFLSDNLPPGWAGFGALAGGEREHFLVRWRRALGEHNLIAVSWPKEYGGAGLTLVEQVVLAEEFARAGVPEGTENDPFSINLLGNTLIHLGTEEQKKRFLPKILSAEHRWCQGYSEPDAGSDLAGLRTRAVREGEQWVINGQKTWTSAARTANWMFLIARTDASVPKHRGLTFLLMPMDQPGVEVRPIRNAAGHAGFNEVFLTDARTPVDNVVGGIGNGWSTAMTLLGFERGSQVTTAAIEYMRDLERLWELATERGVVTDPRIRDQLAWCFTRVQVMRFRGYRGLTSFLRGDIPGADGAISKLIWSEYLQRYAALAAEILGLEAIAPTGCGNGGALGPPEAGTENSSASWMDQLLYGRAATIYAGSSQIQRTVIGEQLLGLPKEPRLDTGPFAVLGSRERES